eukprot:gb/GFBE01010806.1/.p1 GENE.gb/GFBE01010806.1/~~gb/GFBE01010806.1/.p1  ORF type:complete len:186 (+),score=27.95 gb/GFBE01010806.1/:1-558(+)
MEDLCEAGLLEPHEVEELRGRPQKAQLVWSWMTHLWQRLCEQSRVPQAVGMVSAVLEKCATGRNAIGESYVYTDTQLPFAYTHLLALIANATLLLAAISAGATFASATLLVTNIAALLRLLFFLVIFDGLLEIASQLENPLDGDDAMDYPELAYQQRLSEWTAALSDTSTQGWWPDIFESDQVDK